MQGIEEIKRKALPILKSAGATRAAIFGSYARGEARQDSDIDMLVDLPLHYSLLDYIHLKHQIEDVLGLNVDLVEYDVIKPAIRNNILTSALSIL